MSPNVAPYRRAHRCSLIVAMMSALLCLVTACANIGSPEGGPRDYSPPHVMHTSPEAGALNFTGKKVEITFDEIVNIKDQQKKVIISPAPSEQPLVRAMGKKVTIEFRDTLEPNTTYVIDFSNAIEDNNEGNQLDGYSFTFSTGPEIDSLRVSGIVLRASDLEPMQHVLVGLHSNLSDTAFTRLPLERITRTNDRGQFTVMGLKPGKYHVFALNDVDGDYRMARTEDIAFYDQVVEPSASLFPDNVLLSMFNEGYQQLYLKKASRPSAGKLLVQFGAAVDTLPELRVLHPESQVERWHVLERTARGDSLTYWLTDSTLIKADTIAVEMRYQRVDSTERIVWATDTLQLGYKKPRYLVKQEEEEQNSIDPRGVRLEIKRDTLWLPVDGAPSLCPSNEYDLFTYCLPMALIPDTTYRLIVDSAAVTSVYGLVNDPLTIEAKVRALEEYSNLVLRVNVQDHAFVELLDAQSKVLRTVPVVAGVAKLPNVLPNSYYVRLTLDTNGNGRWDTGNYAQHLQPEEVYYYPKALKLRRNWDVDQQWNIYETALDLQKPEAIRKNKPENKKKNGEEEDEDEFNSQGFGRGTYSGDRYRDYQNQNNRR